MRVPYLDASCSQLLSESEYWQTTTVDNYLHYGIFLCRKV